MYGVQYVYMNACMYVCNRICMCMCMCMCMYMHMYVNVYVYLNIPQKQTEYTILHTRGTLNVGIPFIFSVGL